jgi:diphosphomevalonate decarboxylase
MTGSPARNPSFAESSFSLGRAEACANIALAKYWGKSARGGNLTAVPSLSLTLDALKTRTEVRFDAALTADTAVLNGVAVTGGGLERVTALLNRVRKASGEARRAAVVTHNNFPTAAGLASSASGFAALAVAAARAARYRASVAELSSLARQSSASAGRSLFGGFVELEAETDSAVQIAPREHWDVTMLVAVIAAGPKPIGSTGGMVHTAETSPYYPAWVSDAPRLFREVKSAVLARDFARVARAMEHSTLLMHATMMAADPPVLYFRGATVELIDRLRRLRQEGAELGFTMDAGPNVKVLVPRARASELAAVLEGAPGVERVIRCEPGPGAVLLSTQGALETAEPLALPIETLALAADDPGSVAG